MDAVFKALADPVRRALLDRLLLRDGQTLGELCAEMAMTRFGVMKHLRVLETAGLVVARKVGREKLHHLNPMPIQLVHDRWVSRYRAPFAAALSDLKSRLEATMAKTQVYELFIRTTPEKLWQALTDGEISRKYFFGEVLHSTWKKGAPWHSVGPNGARDVEGTVVEVEALRKLVISWRILYDPAMTHELSQVSYLIEPMDKVCKLTVLHDVSEAPLTDQHVAGGWPAVVSSLKSLLETGEPLTMPHAS